MPFLAKDNEDFKKGIKSLTAITDTVKTDIITSSVANLTSIAHNQKTVTTAGTAVQLQVQAIPNGFSIVVKALSTNTGKIYVGLSGVTSGNGFELLKGEAVMYFVDDVSKIWINSSVNGEGVSWTVET